MKDKYYVFEQASNQTGYIVTVGRMSRGDVLSDFKTPEGGYEKLTFYDDIDSACDYLDKRVGWNDSGTYFNHVQESWRIAYNPNMVETEHDKKRLERMGFFSFEDRAKYIGNIKEHLAMQSKHRHPRTQRYGVGEFLPYSVTVEHDGKRDIATIGIDTSCTSWLKALRYKSTNFMNGYVYHDAFACFGSKREAQMFVEDLRKKTRLKVIDTTLPEYDPAQKIVEKEQPASVFEAEAMGLENVVAATTKTTKTSKAKKKIDNTPDFIDTSDIKENGNDHIKEAGE